MCCLEAKRKAILLRLNGEKYSLLFRICIYYKGLVRNLQDIKKLETKNLQTNHSRVSGSFRFYIVKQDFVGMYCTIKIFIF